MACKWPPKWNCTLLVNLGNPFCLPSTWWMLTTRRAILCTFSVSYFPLTQIGMIILNQWPPLYWMAFIILNGLHYIESVAKSAARKVSSLYCAQQFFFCCYIWSGASAIYLDILDRIERRICHIIGPDLASQLVDADSISFTNISDSAELFLFDLVLMCT